MDDAGKKILIVDDDGYLAGTYQIALTKAGFMVRTVADGDEMIEAIGQFNPNLIILDLIMPVKDGLTSLREVKQNPKYQNIPIVVNSNLSRQEDIDRAFSLGAKDYLIKGALSLEDYVTKIESYFQ
jgi:DNA-binding response OmpR family regulator